MDAGARTGSSGWEKGSSTRLRSLTILSKRVAGNRGPVQGPDDSTIQEQVFGPSIKEIDSGKADGATAWTHAMTLLKQLVVNK